MNRYFKTFIVSVFGLSLIPALWLAFRERGSPELFLIFFSFTISLTANVAVLLLPSLNHVAFKTLSYTSWLFPCLCGLVLVLISSSSVLLRLLGVVVLVAIIGLATLSKPTPTIASLALALPGVVSILALILLLLAIGPGYIGPRL